MHTSETTERREPTGRWRSLAAILPGISIALLPRVTCPACWPAYAGLLGSLGLGVLIETAYLLPLTVLFLGVAVLALGLGAKNRRGYGPFALGTAGVVLAVAGKFALDFSQAAYGGVGLLVVASLWNSWPKQAVVSGACPSCASDGPLLEIGVSQTTTNQRRETMSAKRKVEVFSAGCPACQEAVALVQRITCPSCEMAVLDMNAPQVAERAKSLGIRSVPAVVVDGELADCCKGNGPDETTLRAAGLGQPAA